MGMLTRKSTGVGGRPAYGAHSSVSRPLRASGTSPELRVVRPSTEDLYENGVRYAGRVQYQSPCSW